MNQLFNIIFEVFNKASNANPPKNRHSGRQQLLKKKNILMNERTLIQRQAVTMGNDRTLTLMTKKNVTSDWMSFFDV